jgi:hypothetical protein
LIAPSVEPQPETHSPALTLRVFERKFGCIARLRFCRLIRCAIIASPVKFPITTAAIYVFLGCVRASEPSALQFGGEKIGVPPLSLADSIARGNLALKAPRFGAQVPQFARGPEAPGVPPALIPPATPNTRQLGTSKLASSPRVSHSSGMPIVEPRTDIDYKLRIIAPNPAIDFKLAIKDPGTKEKPVEAK